MSAMQNSDVDGRNFGPNTRNRRSVVHYVALLLALVGMVLLGAACGDGGKKKSYRAANTYEGCMNQCGEASECSGVASACQVSCAWLMLDGLGPFAPQFSKAEKECFQGMGQYYACVSAQCVTDENGDPMYDEEGIEECEPIAEKYQAICDSLD